MPSAAVLLTKQAFEYGDKNVHLLRIIISLIFNMLALMLLSQSSVQRTEVRVHEVISNFHNTLPIHPCCYTRRFQGVSSASLGGLCLDGDEQSRQAFGIKVK